MKRILFLIIIIFTCLIQGWGKDSTRLLLNKDTTSLSNDSLVQTKPDHKINFLDTLMQPLLLRKFFFLNENINGVATRIQKQEEVRDLPGLKAIRLRKPEHEHWKFWVLLATVLFLALIRLMNVKRFEEIILSAFDLHTDYKNFSDKSGNYLLSNIGLFINFVLSLSLFLTTLLEINHKFEDENFYLLFWKISLLLLIVYLGKVILNLLLGTIFNMRKISVLTLFNAIMVNNIMGVGLVFLNLFFVFVSDSIMANYISGFILVAILGTVIYRQIKNLIMTPQSGRLHFIYIFLYLCTLEILPWLVLFKLFLNSL